MRKTVRNLESLWNSGRRILLHESKGWCLFSFKLVLNFGIQRVRDIMFNLLKPDLIAEGTK